MSWTEAAETGVLRPLRLVSLESVSNNSARSCSDSYERTTITNQRLGKTDPAHYGGDEENVSPNSVKR